MVWSMYKVLRRRHWHYPRSWIVLPILARLRKCHYQRSERLCSCQIPRRKTTLASRVPQHEFFFFFFFSGALDPDLVVQWSVQWPSDITILNRAGVQWLCRATPEGGYTSTPKSPRNRTWPPGNVPRPNGAPKQSGVLGLLQGNGSHNAEQLPQHELYL